MVRCIYILLGRRSGISGRAPSRLDAWVMDGMVGTWLTSGLVTNGFDKNLRLGNHMPLACGQLKETVQTI